MYAHDIIVVGASMGGVDALRELVGGFPADLPATVFVVLHTSPYHESYLPEILSKAGPLLARHPEDPEEIKQGRIYVAPPDHHLVILDGHTGGVLGPKECRHRPAADTLFRTAAEVYGPRVVGVVLTGALDDGTAGLQAIKEKGGLAIVQDPKEAFAPGMPSNAMKHVAVDYCLPLAQIAPLLVQLARDPAEEPPATTEAAMKKVKSETDQVMSGFTCPECGASLWGTFRSGLPEFRCRVGHTFLPESLLASQSEMIEKALWKALNVIEERVALINLLAGEARQYDQPSVASQLETRRQAVARHSDQIRQMLVGDGEWYSVVDLMEIASCGKKVGSGAST